MEKGGGQIINSQYRTININPTQPPTIDRCGHVNTVVVEREGVYYYYGLVCDVRFVVFNKIHI